MGVVKKTLVFVLGWSPFRGGSPATVDVELSKEESTETRISVQPSNSCADLQTFSFCVTLSPCVGEGGDVFCFLVWCWWVERLV